MEKKMAVATTVIYYIIVLVRYIVYFISSQRLYIIRMMPLTLARAYNNIIITAVLYRSVYLVLMCVCVCVPVYLC